jgi:hypothetical protein|tara:strand:- start:24 stop:233 length:210 start_codon:yes stop_codon:yes gene_type:complete
MSKKYYKVTTIDVTTTDYYIDPDSSETVEEILKAVMEDEWADDAMTTVAYCPIAITQITHSQFEQRRTI